MLSSGRASDRAVDGSNGLEPYARSLGSRNFGGDLMMAVGVVAVETAAGTALMVVTRTVDGTAKALVTAMGMVDVEIGIG